MSALVSQLRDHEFSELSLTGSSPYSLTVCSSTQGVDIRYHCHIVLFVNSWYMVTYFSCVLLYRRIIRWFLQYFSMCQVTLWSSQRISVSIFSLSYIAILCHLLVPRILVISKTTSNTLATVMCDVEDLCAMKTISSIRVCVEHVLSLMLSFWDETSPSTLRSGQYSFTFVSFSTPSFFFLWTFDFHHLLCDRSVLSRVWSVSRPYSSCRVGSSTVGELEHDQHATGAVPGSNRKEK